MTCYTYVISIQIKLVHLSYKITKHMCTFTFLQIEFEDDGNKEMGDEWKDDWSNWLK